MVYPVTERSLTFLFVLQSIFMGNGYFFLNFWDLWTQADILQLLSLEFFQQTIDVFTLWNPHELQKVIKCFWWFFGLVKEFDHGSGDLVDCSSPLQVQFEIFFLGFEALRHQLYF